MKLHELNEKIRSLYDIADCDDEALQDTLESLECEFDDKVQYLVKKVLECETNADICKQEADRIAKRKQAYENRAKRIKEYLQYEMTLANKPKLNYPLFTVYMQNNPPKVVVADESLIPSDYWIEKVEKQLDKKSILELLKSRNEIPGCSLEQGQSLRIK